MTRAVAGHKSSGSVADMKDEKIQVRATDSGQVIDVIVFSKSANQIEIVVGQGTHSIRCRLTPTINGLAYAGTVMGRELVYERSREQVHADIENAKPSTRRR